MRFPTKDDWYEVIWLVDKNKKGYRIIRYHSIMIASLNGKVVAAFMCTPVRHPGYAPARQTVCSRNACAALKSHGQKKGVTVLIEECNKLLADWDRQVHFFKRHLKNMLRIPALLDFF